jgi:tetratricopeptide (TPR) repeat protein
MNKHDSNGNAAELLVLDEAKRELAAKNYQKVIELLEPLAARSRLSGLHLALGKAQAERNANEAAAQSFTRALADDPGGEAHYLLGRILRKSNDFAAALPLLRRAIELDDKKAAHHFECARALEGAGKLNEALRMLKAARRLDPYNHLPIGAAASIERHLGRIDEAIANFRLAIAALQRYEGFLSVPARTIRTGDATSVLGHLHDHLERADLPYFLCVGTLLGIVRERGVMAHDKDVDLGVFAPVDATRIMRELCEKGPFLPSPFARQSVDDVRWRLALFHPEHKISVDIFFYQQDGDHYLCGVNAKPQPILSRPRAFGLARIDWQGKSWPVPAPVDAYLEDFYGPTWKTPDPDFDTIVSSHCQVPASLEVRQCAGYQRVYASISTKNWRRSLSLIDQLAARRQDPYLRDLAAWIGSR